LVCNCKMFVHCATLCYTIAISVAWLFLLVM
jgi:hypothetical protein